MGLLDSQQCLGSVGHKAAVWDTQSSWNGTQRPLEMPSIPVQYRSHLASLELLGCTLGMKGALIVPFCLSPLSFSDWGSLGD